MAIYPQELVKKYFCSHLKSFNKIKPAGSEKFLITLLLPYAIRTQEL